MARVLTFFGSVVSSCCIAFAISFYVSFYPGDALAMLREVFVWAKPEHLQVIDNELILGLANCPKEDNECLSNALRKRDERRDMVREYYFAKRTDVQFLTVILNETRRRIAVEVNQAKKTDPDAVVPLNALAEQLLKAQLELNAVSQAYRR